MTELRNENGTYNVYDFTQDKWVEVNENNLNNVNLKNAVELEYHYGSSNKELKVVYKDELEVWYQNIHGSWGMPYTIK